MAEVTDWNHIIRKTCSLSPLLNFCQEQNMTAQLQMLSIKHEWVKMLEIINCVAKNVLLRMKCLAHSRAYLI